MSTYPTGAAVICLLFGLFLSACGMPTPLVWMPPPEFDHPFNGAVIYHPCPGCGNVGVPYSMSVHDKDTCHVWLSTRGDPDVRAKAERIEIANCNGWAKRDGDINQH